MYLHFTLLPQIYRGLHSPSLTTNEMSLQYMQCYFLPSPPLPSPPFPSSFPPLPSPFPVQMNGWPVSSVQQCLSHFDAHGISPLPCSQPPAADYFSSQAELPDLVSLHSSPCEITAHVVSTYLLTLSRGCLFVYCYLLLSFPGVYHSRITFTFPVPPYLPTGSILFLCENSLSSKIASSLKFSVSFMYRTRVCRCSYSCNLVSHCGAFFH